MNKIINGAYGSLASRRKILFANVPADGHFGPLTGIAKHLQQEGYDVRWYCSSQYEERIKKLDIPYYTFKKALELTGTNIEQLLPERARHTSEISKLNFDLINFFILRAPEYFEDIAEIRKSFAFDMVIADCVFCAIPLIREKLQVPVVAIGVLPLTETSKDLPPSGMGMTPLPGFRGRLKQGLLRWYAEKVLFRKSDRVYKQVLRQHGIDPKGVFLFNQVTRSATLLLQSGTPGFEYKRSDLSSNVRFVGPLLPYDSGKERTPWHDKKLWKYEKIILATQGTVEKETGKLLVPALEAFKDSEYLVVATTGGSGTAELREKYPHNNIIIEDFIPFADIMPHADVYITNGGYGGVMLSVKNELPIVAAGVHEGKNEINARIGHFKLGINLGTEHPSPEQIRNAVIKVINDPAYRINVQDLCDEFDHYNPNGLCQSYIEGILKNNLQIITRSGSIEKVYRSFSKVQ